ncbi:MAG: AMP-binding protein, partial [Acidobacteria bacterium]|nr:AMP-binding protein [Acidobacteriota bacterium]
MSNGSDVRLFMILTAGLTVLIYKYIGSPDVILGTSIYKQELDVELINRILALRNYLNSNMTFKDLLLQVKQTHTEAVENQDYPFETLAYKLNLSDVEGEFSLFETVILLENIHDISYIENTHPSILFHFNREDEILECRVEFDSRRYTAETVKRIGLHLENLLRQALANVETKVRCLEILSSREKQQLLYDFNAAQDTINSNTSRPIPCLFAETAAKNLFQIALDYEDQQLTFNVLQQQVDRLALALSKKFVNTRTITALMLDKSLDMVISLLAVLKIGAAYLPILPGYPRERIRYIFRDSRPWGILTQTKYLDELKNIEKSEGLESLEGLEVIDIE